MLALVSWRSIPKDTALRLCERSHTDSVARNCRAGVKAAVTEAFIARDSFPYSGTSGQPWEYDAGADAVSVFHEAAPRF